MAIIDLEKFICSFMVCATDIKWAIISALKDQGLDLPTINKYSNDGTLICSYNSVSEAAEDTRVHHSSISQCFTGKKKSAGGFIWKKEL